MNLVKLFIIVLATTAFVVSCGQSATVSNVKITAESPAVAKTADSTTKVAPVNAAEPGKRLQRAVAMAEEEPLTDDLYATNCMICHKDTGKGGKTTIEGKSINPIDLTSAKVKARSDDKLLAQIREGSPDDGMPAFKGKLSDEEIKSIIQHVRSLQ